MRLDDDTTLFVDCKTSVEAGVVVEASCVGDRILGRGTEKASTLRMNQGTMAKAVVGLVFMAWKFMTTTNDKCN